MIVGKMLLNKTFFIIYSCAGYQRYQVVDIKYVDIKYVDIKYNIVQPKVSSDTSFYKTIFPDDKAE